MLLIVLLVLLIILLFKFRRTLNQTVKMEESTVPLPVVESTTRQINLIPEQPINLGKKADVTYIPLVVQKQT